MRRVVPHRLRRLAPAALLLAVACGPQQSPTPAPTTFPIAPASAAVALGERYVAAWAGGDWAAMHGLLAPADRQRYPLERFTALHAGFAEMTVSGELRAELGEPRPAALRAQPRPPDFPPPAPTPPPTPDPSAAAVDATSTAFPSPEPIPDPATPLDGPVPATAIPARIALETERFGAMQLERDLLFTQGPDGWQVRWTPATIFPELGADGDLRLDRQLSPRGDIVGVDGTVWATTREDGVRVYPQEALAGQTIGYVGEVTAEDLERLAGDGYLAGDVVGRSGLEVGAEALLRGRPGWTLSALAGGATTVLHAAPAVAGATLTITLQPDLQLAAHRALLPYGNAATAVIDPATGDVWALASAPAFNPNAMTTGTTLAGEPLAPAGSAEIFNRALLGAYPAGSSLKPFTLAAALHTGVAEPASRVSCPPTWQFSGFTFRNYQDHALPGLVSLAEAMAFSCNTTYMPLALDVYEADPTALTELLAEFGFGQPTGIRHIIEEIGILPDDAWLRAERNLDYGPFDQVQLAIGQGAYLGTPLQLANAYAAIGNGGTRWVPRLVAAATLPDGEVVEEFEPTFAHRLSVSAADLAYVTDTLEAVVTLPYGTGTAAFAGFGIPVAGKSGTAETGLPEPHAWFPAFAPADSPTIAAATVLVHIALGTGGSDAAPIVRSIFAAHFS